MKTKPSIITGLLWGKFAGTATVSAFILPGLFAGYIFVPGFLTRYDLLIEAFVLLSFYCGWYHAWYRLKALGHDLDLGIGAKILEVVAYTMITLGTLTFVIKIIEFITTPR
jgi:hypothetical protein